MYSGLTFCNFMLTILLRFIKRPLVYCTLFFLEDKQFLATRILVLATKNENLEASWPQEFFLKVEPCEDEMRKYEEDQQDIKVLDFFQCESSSHVRSEFQNTENFC